MTHEFENIENQKKVNKDAFKNKCRTDAMFHAMNPHFYGGLTNPDSDHVLEQAEKFYAWLTKEL